MKIDIQDPYGHQYSITSRDPETIGRWLIEIFAAINLQSDDPPVWFQAWPSWNQENMPDWLTDTRVLTKSLGARSPEEMLQAMAGALESARDLTNREAITDGDDSSRTAAMAP